MKINLRVLSFVLLSSVHFAASFVLESLAIGGAAGAAAAYVFRCQFTECCSSYYVPQNTAKLKRQMEGLLYGQHIAQKIVYGAVRSHVTNPNPKKPLVLSFHGGTRTGKNYVADMIASSMFQLSLKSKYYHFFNGLADFPSKKTGMAEKYMLDLKKKIQDALSDCEHSMFVFDEVEKIPPRLLDMLVPFIDYTSWSKVENKKAIFIFISNTGNGEIVERMLELWENGVEKRENIGIEEFEYLIELGAFNQEGGFYRGGTIASKVIDYHVPFLPLVEKHVIMCIKHIFKSRGVINPPKYLINKALRHVLFGPPPHNLYATSGCKPLENKVSSLLYSKEFDD